MDKQQHDPTSDSKKQCVMRSHVTPGKEVCTNLFQVNVISQLHVLGVNLKNLQSASGVRDANVHLPIETTWTQKEGIKHRL